MENKKTPLHQLLANDSNNKQRFEDDLNTAMELSKDHAGFSGERSVRKFLDNDTPDETLKDEIVATTVGDVLDLLKPFGHYLDFVARVDEANGRAKATVEIDGKELSGCEDLPAVTLLAYEKLLKRMRRIFETLPVRVADEEWTVSDELRDGVFKSRSQSKHSYKRVPTPIRVFEPSEHCQGGKAEIREVEEMAGTIVRTLFSGAPSRQERDKILRRFDQLIGAVASGRAKANETEISRKLSPGKALMSFLVTGG